MKRIRLKKEGFDICVTIDVKTIYREKASGELDQELDRLETSRILQNIGSREEGPLARKIANNAKEILEER